MALRLRHYQFLLVCAWCNHYLDFFTIVVGDGVDGFLYSHKVTRTILCNYKFIFADEWFEGWNGFAYGIDGGCTHLASSTNAKVCVVLSSLGCSSVSVGRKPAEETLRPFDTFTQNNLLRDGIHFDKRNLHLLGNATRCFEIVINGAVATGDDVSFDQRVAFGLQGDAFSEEVILLGSILVFEETATCDAVEQHRNSSLLARFVDKFAKVVVERCGTSPLVGTKGRLGSAGTSATIL